MKQFKICWNYAQNFKLPNSFNTLLVDECWVVMPVGAFKYSDRYFCKNKTEKTRQTYIYLDGCFKHLDDETTLSWNTNCRVYFKYKIVLICRIYFCIFIQSPTCSWTVLSDKGTNISFQGSNKHMYLVLWAYFASTRFLLEKITLQRGLIILHFQHTYQWNSLGK